MNEFLRQVVEILRATLEALGIKNMTLSIPSWGGGIYVSECFFGASMYRRGVRIEGTRFKMTDTQGAANHILKRLPAKKEEQRKEKERQTKYDTSLSISKYLPQGVIVRFDDYQAHGKFSLLFSHQDKLVIMAAADYLQDGGFCGDNAPTKDTEGLPLRSMLRIWDTLTDEQKAEFMNTIKQGEDECQEKQIT